MKQKKLNIKNYEDINIFLRHYWLSAEGVVKQQDLLSEIQTKITTRKEVFKFLEILREEAEKYDALLSLTQDYWDKKDSRIVELLKELQNTYPKDKRYLYLWQVLDYIQVNS